jgi:hypothetical protein
MRTKTKKWIWGASRPFGEAVENCRQKTRIWGANRPFGKIFEDYRQKTRIKLSFFAVKITRYLDCGSQHYTVQRLGWMSVLEAK